MEIINSLFHFFTDKTKGLSSKVVLIIIALVSLVLIDNLFNFSTNFNNQYKLEQIEKINTILEDTTLTSNEKKTMLSLRNNIIFHKTWKDVCYDEITNVEFSYDPKNEQVVIEKIKRIDPNYFWRFLSSSWLVLILMIGLPFVALADKETSFSKSFAILIVVEPLFYLLCLGLTKLFSYLDFFEKDTHNFIFYASINLITLIILIYFSNKNSKN